MARKKGARRTNLVEIENLLDSLEDACDLTGPGNPNGTLYNDIASIVGGEILARTLDGQQTEDGEALELNRGDYGIDKRNRGIPIGVGVDDDEPKMLQLSQMVGNVRATSDEMTQELGTTEFIQDKIEWFHKGRESNNQPARPFVGLDDIVIDLVMDRLGDQIENILDGD